jgi:hypothetical protein
VVGEWNVCGLRFVVKCTAFIDDALSRLVMTDEVSVNEKGKK